MKHSDPIDTTSRDSSGPATSPSSSMSHMNGGGVPPNETLLNALRLHHLRAVQQDEARRRRGGLPPITPPQSPPFTSEDIYSSASWLSSPSIGFSARQRQHPGASPPTSMNGGWGSPTGRSESAALQDTRRRHLLGILSAALDELSDGALDIDPMDDEADLDE